MGFGFAAVSCGGGFIGSCALNVKSLLAQDAQ
jgi:hypothetical protein